MNCHFFFYIYIISLASLCCAVTLFNTDPLLFPTMNTDADECFFFYSNAVANIFLDNGYIVTLIVEVCHAMFAMIFFFF